MFRSDTSLPALAAAALLATGVGACGDDENSATFTAAGFVQAVNREGAGLALGEQLPSTATSYEVFSATFTEHPGGVEDAREEEQGHRAEGNGHAHGRVVSLVVTASDEAAIAEYERCESALSLTCFRAANVVAYMEAEDPHLVERLAEAIKRLAAT